MVSVASSPGVVKPTRSRPETKRTFRVLRPIRPGAPGRVAITVQIGGGKPQTKEYTVTVWPLPSGEGIAAEYAPDGEEAHHVALTADGDSCDCWGHCRHGHCRHAANLRVLVTCGFLLPEDTDGEDES